MDVDDGVRSPLTMLSSKNAPGSDGIKGRGRRGVGTPNGGDASPLMVRMSSRAHVEPSVSSPLARGSKGAGGASAPGRRKGGGRSAAAASPIAAGAAPGIKAKKNPVISSLRGLRRPSATSIGKIAVPSPAGPETSPLHRQTASLSQVASPVAAFLSELSLRSLASETLHFPTDAPVGADGCARITIAEGLAVLGNAARAGGWADEPLVVPVGARGEAPASSPRPSSPRSDVPPRRDFGALPQAAVRAVFGHLPPRDRFRALSVCRPWHDVAAADAALWPPLDLRGVVNRFDDASAFLVGAASLARCPAVVAAGCSLLTDVGCAAIALRASAARALDFSGTRCGDDALAIVAEACPAVASVDVSGCDAVTDVGTAALLACPVKHLIVSRCTAITAAGLARSVASGRAEIVQIEMDEIGGSDADLAAVIRAVGKSLRALGVARTAFGPQSAAALAEHCPLLERLDASGTPLGDNAMAVIARACSSLKYVALWECRAVTARAIVSIAEGCPALESIDIEGCTNIDAACIEALASKCHKLRVVDLQGHDGVTDAAIVRLADSLEGLEQISAESGSIGDDALAALANSPASMHLAVVRLPGCSVTDAGIATLAAGRVPALVELDLSQCTSVSDAGVRSIAESAIASAGRVERISLEGCHAVTDAAASQLIRQCTRLRHIDVSATSAGAAAFHAAMHSSTLRFLNMSGCTGSLAEVDVSAVGSATIESLALASCAGVGPELTDAIARRCPRLTTLDLCGTSTTNDMLLAIVSTTPNLARLFVGGCTAITDRGIATAIVRAPHVRIFR